MAEKWLEEVQSCYRLTEGFNASKGWKRRKSCQTGTKPAPDKEGCQVVAKRESIIKIGSALAELVIEGGGGLPAAKEQARRLLALCRTGGTYQKQYDDPQERVLNRHLNLYRNKLAAAKTDAERFRWKGKLVEQEAKLAAFHRGSVDLDLDGL